MIEHWVNQEKYFIGGWYNDDIVCDDIIQHYYSSPTKRKGEFAGKGNSNVKKSTDCSISDNSELYDRYIDYLGLSILKYREKFPRCHNIVGPWDIIEHPVIQHYRPNEGFLSWHTERATSSWPADARHLVYMTYLNDVEDEGGTEFYHQNIKIKAEKGLTLIWPADWTYTHRGIPSPTEEKFIITGWISFMPTPDILQRPG